MIYFRLSLKNIRKSIKEYSIYLLTLILCSALYYGFNAIASDSRIGEIVPSIEMLYTQMKSIVSIVMFSIVFLVLYINNFIIKRRSKEFAVYTLLGMRQFKIAFLFFMENVYIGIISVICGSAIGSGIGYFLRGIIIKSLNIPLENNMIFDIGIFLRTFKFMISIFIIVGIINMIKIGKGKLIDLLKNSQKNEKKLKNNKVYGLIFIVAMSLWSFAFYKVYSGFMNYGNVSDDAKDYAQIISMIMIVISTFGIYISLGGFLTLIKNRFKQFFSNEGNLFLITEMISKAISKSTIMACISIVIMISLIAFSLGFIMEMWGTNNITSSRIYDLEVYNNYNDVREEKVSLDTNFDHLFQQVETMSEVKDGLMLKLYFNNKEDFYKRKKVEFPALLMRVSDYNEVRRINGSEGIEIKPGEYFIHYSQRFMSEDEIENLDIIKDGLAISDGQILSFSGKDDTYFGKAIKNDYVGYTIIVNDGDIKDKKIAKSSMIINFKDEIGVIKGNQINSMVRNLTSDLIHDELEIESWVKEISLRSSRVNVSVVKLTGILIGTLFIIMSFTVLAVQQLIESIQNRHKYIIINKLGISKKRIKSIINKQTAIYFIMPMILSIGGFLIFIQAFRKGFERTVDTLIGDGNIILMGVILPAVIFLSIYLAYYVLTVFICRKNIESDIQ